MERVTGELRDSLFTTAEYAAALFRFWTGFTGLADVDAGGGGAQSHGKVYPGELR